MFIESTNHLIKSKALGNNNLFPFFPTNDTKHHLTQAALQLSALDSAFELEEAGNMFISRLVASYRETEDAPANGGKNRFDVAVTARCNSCVK